MARPASAPTGTTPRWRRRGTVAPNTHIGAAGTIIRNLHLKGGYAGTESESHGIQFRETCHVENVSIAGFARGRHFRRRHAWRRSTRANPASRPSPSVYTFQCRNGWYIDGADSNGVIWRAAMPRATAATARWTQDGDRQFDRSAAASPPMARTAAKPTKCCHGGNRYYVLPDQSTGAAANAPSGTTANNTWWGYLACRGDGGRSLRPGRTA